MVRDRVDILGLLRKQAEEADLDFLREALSVLSDAIMDVEVTNQKTDSSGELVPLRAATKKNDPDIYLSATLTVNESGTSASFTRLK
mgnify:CR=1 FL=1